MSHTVTVRIEIKDREALALAVADLKGAVLGNGTHKLFAGLEQGYGFQLPNWRYPLVARADNTLAFDDYHGSWGNPADIEKLRERYAIHAADRAAQAQGWYTEHTQDGNLLIYHPDGGTLTVTPAGTIDAQGFGGSTCSNATAPIAEALGQTTGETRKPVYNETDQEVNQHDD